MLFQNYSKIALIIVFSIAAITDWFDGFFARKLKQTSKLGARMDQIVDRIFTIMIVFALIFYLVSRSGTFDNMFLLSSDNIFLLLFLTTSREIIGAPGVFIALVRRKSTYNVKYVGKVTTFIQSVTLGTIILGWPIAIYFAIATCLVGIVSGFDYLKYSLN
jgi:phosphatidylglycerophosphate synthase